MFFADLGKCARPDNLTNSPNQPSMLGNLIPFLVRRIDCQGIYVNNTHESSSF